MGGRSPIRAEKKQSDSMVGAGMDAFGMAAEAQVKKPERPTQFVQYQRNVLAAPSAFEPRRRDSAN